MISPDGGSSCSRYSLAAHGAVWGHWHAARRSRCQSGDPSSRPAAGGGQLGGWLTDPDEGWRSLAPPAALHAAAAPGRREFGSPPPPPADRRGPTYRRRRPAALRWTWRLAWWRRTRQRRPAGLLMYRPPSCLYLAAPFYFRIVGTGAARASHFAMLLVLSEREEGQGWTISPGAG